MPVLTLICLGCNTFRSIKGSRNGYCAKCLRYFAADQWTKEDRKVRAPERRIHPKMLSGTEHGR